MNRETYIADIIKKLSCKSKQKRQIKHELESDILSAEESGESWEEIIARMGTPDEVAAEFNANITVTDVPLRKKRIITVLITAVSVIVLIIAGLLFLNYKYAVHEADSDEVQMSATLKTAEEVIILVSNDDIDTLYDEYAAESIKDAMDKEELKEEILAAKDSLNLDWGNYQKITSHYESTVKQGGKYYSAFEIVALYDNLSVTYTITFDQAGKMMQLFIK